MTIFDATLRTVQPDDLKLIGREAKLTNLLPRGTVPVVEAELANGQSADLTDRIKSQLHDEIIAGFWSVNPEGKLTVRDSALAALRLPVDLSEAMDYKLSYRFTVLDGKEGLGTFLAAQQKHIGAIINSEGGKGSGFEFVDKNTFDNETSKPPFQLEKGKTYVCESHTRIADGKVSATLHLSLAGQPRGEPYLTLNSHPTAGLQWKPHLHHVERVVQGTGVPTFHAHFSRFTIEAVKVEVLQSKAKILSWKQGPIVPMK